jgi:hypothetical protein
MVSIAAASAHAANPIVAENSKPGDSSWRAVFAADNDAFGPAIQGFAGANSVRPGATIDFHVDASLPGRYRVVIVRLGWYGGAGGRRVTCLTGSTLDPTCTADEPGVLQPAAAPPNRVTGEVAVNWSVTDRLHVPPTWTTGYYVALFEGTGDDLVGETAFAPFIVQAPVGDRSPILVVVPSNTWQAYNDWGGRSVYTQPRAVKVSFNRPNLYEFLFRWEYPLIKFLERNGYDISYATDDDVERDPSIMLAHRLDVAAGHGEYWTRRERNAWQAARAHGVNLAFMGANTGYWQVRYEDHDRTMVSYKYSRDPDPNPAVKTVQFRELKPPRPECELLGEQYNTDNSSSEDGRYFNYTITSAGANDAWLAGTGLRAGDLIKGIVGFEFDSLRPSCHVPPVTVLFHFNRRPFTADAVRYRACSGAEVFDAGSLFFSWGLDSFRDPEYSPPEWPPPPTPVSPALQRFMKNAIADMLVAHPRFNTTAAVRVSRHGSIVRVNAGVRSGTTRVRGYAISSGADGHLRFMRLLRVRTRGAWAWHVSLPRAAAALMLDVSVRTGDVSDSRQYILGPNGHGGVVGPADQLEGASCYGPTAHVLTAVFGGERHRPLRIAVDMPRPFTIGVMHGGARTVSVRIGGRGRGPSVVTIPANAIPPGRSTIVVADRVDTFRLGAVGAKT